MVLKEIEAKYERFVLIEQNKVFPGIIHTRLSSNSIFFSNNHASTL